MSSSRRSKKRKEEALATISALKLSQSLMGNSTVVQPSTSSSTIPLKRAASSDNEKENTKNQRQQEKNIAEPPQEPQQAPQQEGVDYLFPVEDSKENDAQETENEVEFNLPIGGGMQDAEEEEDDAIIDQEQEGIYDVDNTGHLPEYDVEVFSYYDNDDPKEKVEKLKCTFCSRIGTRRGGITKLRNDCKVGTSFL